MKKIALGLTMIVFSGVISNVSYAVNFNPENEIERRIESELQKDAGEGINYEEVTFDLESEELVVEVTSDIGGEDTSIEIISDISEEHTTAESFVVKEVNEGIEQEYTLFFGSLEQKNMLEKAMIEEEEILRDIEAGKYTEEEISNIELPTEAIFKNEDNQITSEEELLNSPMVIVNSKTEEVKEILPETGIASFAFAIPHGIIITKQLAIQLIKISFAVIISGLLGLSLSLVASSTMYRRYYSHYRAVRTGKIGIVVLNGMTLNTAVNYMKIRGDVWSVSSDWAWKVAKYAGTPIGGILKNPTKVEVHGIGNYPHFHTWNRQGGHSFYGTAKTS